MGVIEPWPASKLEIAASKDEIFVLIGQGYRLCVEDDACFMEEGFRHMQQDRPRIAVTRDAAEAALESKTLRQMTDDEVIERIQIDPRNRKFYLMVI